MPRLPRTTLAPRLTSAFLLLSAFLAGSPLQSQIVSSPASRITAKVDDSVRVALPGTVHPLARPANDRGLLADSTPLERIQIQLKRSDAQEASLHQLLDDLHNPASPSFHKWLTPEKFGKQFSASDQEIAAVSAWLTAKGFTVTKLHPGRQTLEFAGTAGLFRKAFQAELHEYLSGGQTRVSNSAAPQIPAALAPVFGNFVSLNNFPAHPPLHLTGPAQYDPATHRATPTGTKGPAWTIGSSTTGYNFILAPSDFAVQYDLAPLYTAGTNGAGQTIAVLGIANIDLYYVNQFRTLFGLPASQVQVIIDGQDPGLNGINNPYGQNGFGTEAYLDVEESGAVAPGATIDFVIAGETPISDGYFLAAEHAVYNNLAPIMSMSVEECETALGSGNQFLRGLYQQAAAQGITVVVSSSDSGSAGCDNFDSQSFAIDGQQVNGFSSTPYNVSVGGTDFFYSNYAQTNGSLGTQLQSYWSETPSNSTPATSIKGVIPEQVWNDSQFGLNGFNAYAAYGETNIVASSGGPSTCGIQTTSGSTLVCTPYAKPAWQKGTGVPADGVRDLPDVSLFAANGYNYSYYPICVSPGDCQAVAAGATVQISGAGGTSASAPAFAGIMALITQKYGRQGQVNYTLYPLAQQYPASFHDVTAGSNSVPCNLTTTTTNVLPKNCIPFSSSPTITDATYGRATEGQLGSGATPYYNAGVGYDLATGLGTVDAAVMIANWTKVSFAGTATTLTPSATSFAHGTLVNITGTVTGSSPTGTVGLMTTSTAPNAQNLPSFTVASGAFSGTTNTLPGGTYSLFGRYSGDSLNAPSQSNPVSVTVTPEPSATGLTLLGIGRTSQAYVTAANAIPYGTLVDVVALTAPSASLNTYVSCKFGTATCPVFGIPTGSMSYADTGVALGFVPVDGNGEGSLTYPAAVGTHSVVASYSGDASYSASVSAASTFTVVKATPTIRYSVASAGSAGGPTLITYQVASLSIGTASAAAPTGSLTITGGPAGIPGTVSLAAGLDPSYNSPEGTGVLVIPAGTLAGTYTFTATYPGDGNYNGATYSFQLVLSPTPAGRQSSTMVATLSSPTISALTPSLLTVTVTGIAGYGAPSGYLSVYVNGTFVAQPTLAGGTSVSSTYTTQLPNGLNLAQGASVLTFSYGGSSIYAGSGTTVTVTQPIADFALLTTQPTVTAANNAASAPIAVNSLDGFAGAVTLSCSAPATVTCSLAPASVTLAGNGTASSVVTVNTAGVKTSGSYTVLVTGVDSTGQNVHSAPVTVNVTVSASSFALTAANAITIASQGASGSTGLTLTPAGSFAGAVNLTCSVTASPAGAINLPGCTVTTPVNVTALTPASATLNVTTTAQMVQLDRRPFGWLAATGGTAFAALLGLLLVPARRRRMPALLAALLLAALLGGVAGCGKSSTPAPSTPTGGTTLGTYTVTVTGADAATGKVTASVGVSVIVN